MRDISGLYRDIETYTGENKALAQEINDLLQRYKRESEAMETAYDVLGARPWYIDFNENSEIIGCEWSDRYRRKLGYTDENDFPNVIDSWINVISPEDHDRVVEAFWKTVNGRDDSTKFDVKYHGIKKDGTECYFHSAGAMRRREDGSPQTFVGLTFDITEESRRLDEIREQYEIVEALSRDYLNVFMVDISKRTATILKLNGYVTEGFGDIEKKVYPYEPFCAQYIKDRVYKEDQKVLTEMMSLEKVKEMLDKSGEYVYGYRAVDKGEIHFYQFTYLKLESRFSGDKVIAGFKNIDAIVASAREREVLKKLSETDIMTGIYNRGYGEKLARELVEGGAKGMLCILDIDKFKEVNDTYGHYAGDKAVIAVAECLKKAFGEKAVVFRLGGDEFSAVIEGYSSRESGKGIIDTLFREIEELDIPELVGSRFFTSVGVAFFGREGDSRDFEQLYKGADECVYLSKKTEGNKVNFFN